MYDGCWYADKVTDFNTPIVLAASEWSVEGEQVAAPERTVDPKEGVASAGNSNWLYTSVSEGVVAMGDTAYVAITLDAGGLYGGVYETNLMLMTNALKDNWKKFRCPFSLRVHLMWRFLMTLCFLRMPL